MNESIPDSPRPRIWVDGDACPRGVKEIIYKSSIKRKLPTIFVANMHQNLPRIKYIYQIVVEKGPDEADKLIVKLADKQDIVITHDIPLAAELVKKSVITINPRGEIYTDVNISARLATRNLMSDLRSEGLKTGGPKGYSEKNKQQFASSLDKYLTKLSNKYNFK